MKQDKSNCHMYIWGVPVEEAAEVVEAYKYKHDIPSEGYVDGFQDGIEYTKTLYEDAITEKLKYLRGFSSKNMNAIPIGWIKKWKEKAADGSLCCSPLDLFDHYEYEAAISRLLSDWEKENE